MSTRPPRRATASAPESSGARSAMAAKPQSEKNRPALRNITNNQRPSGSLNQRPSLASLKPMVPCTSKVAKTKKVTGNSLPATYSLESDVRVRNKDGSLARNYQSMARAKPVLPPSLESPVPITSRVSPSGSVSLDEAMSTCDSYKSPEVEYVDAGNVSVVESTEKRTSLCLCLPKRAQGDICKKETLGMGKIVDIDDNVVDPQFCATLASDIYKYLRESEARRRPSVDFMERVQKDINPCMRAIMIDWLVEVTEEYRLLPETLFLAVNYIDRYLSGNAINRQKLQLLGVTCMMIAAKYEEVTAPNVHEFSYVTDNTYSMEEVLQMESTVLSYLKFEMSATTTKCFLRRFICAAQAASEVSFMQFECLVNYIAELSLLDYSMLSYAPSLIAASATFLAKFILAPSKKPWVLLVSQTFYFCSHCSRKHVSHLIFACRIQLCIITRTTTLLVSHLIFACRIQLCIITRTTTLLICTTVSALCIAFASHVNSHLPAVREKYSQHKYKFVARKYCSRSIPVEFFCDLSDQQ